MSEAPVPVIFVLSGNYAGSHLLAQCLGAHPRCADIGELRNFRKLAGRRGPNAAGTETRFADDPLYADFDRLAPSRWHRTLLERIRAQDDRVECLVDNSKRLDWFEARRREPDIDARPVHLLRDPRALARRWGAEFASPADRRRVRLREARRRPRRAPRVLAAPQAGVYGWRWLRENETFTAALDARAPRLAYEELMAHPEATLRRLMDALGLDFAADQLEYWRAPQYGTRKTAWSAAAPAVPFRADARWRDDLDGSAQAAIGRIRPIQDYLARIGYRMADDGLDPVARRPDDPRSEEDSET